MFHDQCSPADPVPWPPTQTPVDLKTLSQSLSRQRTALPATPGQFQRIASLVESSPREVRASPLVPAGFLDGVQSRGVLARREHRELTLAWVAAGAVHARRTTASEERLAVVCSTRDAAIVRTASDVPIVELAELHPWNVALATGDWIDQTRRKLEGEVLAAAPCQPGQVLVVDGSLPAACGRDDAIGVVKRANPEWLSDPSLFPTDGGWRSPALRLPALLDGERDRLTAFVRLRSATGAHPWNFSLVRVETFEEMGGVDFLDAAAALALRHAQSLSSPDPRAAVQLRGMWEAEEALKARIPLAIRHLP